MSFEYALSTKQSIFLLLYHKLPCLDVIDKIYTLMKQIEYQDAMNYHKKNIRESFYFYKYNHHIHDIHLEIITLFSSHFIRYLPTSNNSYLCYEECYTKLLDPTFQQKVTSINHIIELYKLKIFELKGILTKIPFLIIDDDNRVFW